MKMHGFLIPILFALAGCSSSSTPQALAPDHPANPDALAAPLSPSITTLAISQTPTTAASGEMDGMKMGQTTQQGMSGTNHNMEGMQHEMPMAPPDQNSASSAPAPTSAPAVTQPSAVYTCSMHPEVISDKPGKCPKCGMKLVLKKGGR